MKDAGPIGIGSAVFSSVISTPAAQHEKPVITPGSCLYHDMILQVTVDSRSALSPRRLQRTRPTERRRARPKLTNARIRLYAIDAVQGAWDEAMFHVRALKLSRPERCPERQRCQGRM